MTEANFRVFADALTVTFRAKRSGRLSEMPGVSSRITRAEACSLASERLQIALRFGSSAGTTISGAGFELYRNEPIPLVNRTVTGMHLPEAAGATL